MPSENPEKTIDKRLSKKDVTVSGEDATVEGNSYSENGSLSENRQSNYGVGKDGVVVVGHNKGSATNAGVSATETSETSLATPASTAGATVITREQQREESNALKVVRLKHWGRWIASAIVIFIVVQFVWSLFTTKNYQWDVVWQYFFSRAVLDGLGVTLELTVIAVVFGFILGAILAVFRLSGSPVLRSIAWWYIWFFRSVPLIVLILFLYNLGYLYPTLGLGTPFTADFWIFSFNTTQVIAGFAAAAVGLVLNQASYSAEIIRAGILSVDKGQQEAAAALGIPRHRRFLRLVLPQAARSILPNAFNEIINQLKGTAVVYIVAIPELFYTVQTIYSRNAMPVPLLLVAVVWYVVFTTILSIIQFYIERHYAKGSGSPLPATPAQKLAKIVGRLWRYLGDDNQKVPAE